MLSSFSGFPSNQLGMLSPAVRPCHWAQTLMSLVAQAVESHGPEFKPAMHALGDLEQVSLSLRTSAVCLFLGQKTQVKRWGLREEETVISKGREKTQCDEACKCLNGGGA